MSRPSSTPAPRSRRARRALGRLAALAALAAAAACTENLESGVACPALCPDQNLTVLDTIIEPTIGGFGTAADSAALDTTLAGYPGIGSEGSMLLANRPLGGGDALVSYAIIRYDSLPRRFIQGGADSAIYQIDSAYIQIVVDTVSARRRVPGPVTLEVFDVDTAVTGLADTAVATLVPLFRPDRLIGSRVVPPELLRDSVKIPLDSLRLLAKLTAEGPTRLRVGIRASAGGAPVQLRIGSADGGRPARLNYDPSPDTTVDAPFVGPFSKEPLEFELGGLANALGDFTLLVDPFRAEPDSLLQVGGLPGRRAFLRFHIPSSILDSSTIIRATLLLTQRPDPRAELSDTVTVQPLVVRAGTRVGVARAASVLDFDNVHQVDSLRLVSSDSGVRAFEIVRVVAGYQTVAQFIPGWAQIPRLQQQHAIVFRAVREGELPVQALFYSSEASPALRPRLRLSYVPSTPLGTR